MPIPMPGVLFGISYVRNAYHLVRAVMEGVSYSQFDCLNLMKELGISSDKVVLFGGGARSKLWRQITADIFGTRIVTLNVEEGPSYGAAILAGVGVDIYTSVRTTCSRVLSSQPVCAPSKGISFIEVW